MFGAADLLNLLHARPFVPFHLILSDGGTVEVRTPEVVVAGRRFVLVGLLDADANDRLVDRWTVVWYMHVTRAEQLAAGLPPFTAPPCPATSPTPSPAGQTHFATSIARGKGRATLAGLVLFFAFFLSLTSLLTIPA